MSDIVNRLRANRECLAPCLMDDAAAEIERLEQVVLALTAERDDARRERDEALDTMTDEELQYWHKAVSRARIAPHQALACRVALGFVEATRSGTTPSVLMYKMLAQCGIHRCNEEASK